MNKEINSLKELKNEGKQIAFVYGNRDIANTNLKNKKESLARCKCNLVPMMVVEGTKAVEDGCSLVNPSDGKTISNEDAANYVAIVDGQHRYTAYLKLKEEYEKNQTAKTDDNTVTNDTLPELYFFYAYSDMPTNKLLSIANMDSFKYSSKDYAKGAAAFNSNDELAKFANEYASKGFSISTLSIYIFQRSGILKNDSLGKLMQGERLCIKCNSYLYIAKEVVPLLINKLGIKFAKTRYCANAIWEVLTTTGTANYKVVIDAINKLEEKDIDDITKLKGDVVQENLTTILKVLCKQPN